MTQAFERGFFCELRDCLEKSAAQAAARAPAAPPAPPPPSTKPPSPFDPERARGAPAPGKAPPPGLHKESGVASGLERLYLTLGPSGPAKKALRYATPRVGAHLLGQDAAKLYAQGKPGFGELVAKGRRWAEGARGALEKGAGSHPPAGPLARAMGDVESLEHRLRHLAAPAERRAVHEAGRAIARERRHEPEQREPKIASAFGQALRALAHTAVEGAA
jgi:hypothetical protein